jgi:quercetin dioxygenase-like cupin family protein
MTLKAFDINATVASLPLLKGQTAETEGAEAAAAFATIATTENGAVFTGSFEGQSAWERHPNGDELVQVIGGKTQLTIIQEQVPVVLEMKAGMVTVVPRGCWHQFNAPTGVTVLTMTPQPTDHSSEDILAKTG